MKVSDRMFRELEAAGVALKRAAHFGRIKVTQLRRVRRGETRSFDVETLAAIAAKMEDPKGFILRSFGLDETDAGDRRSAAIVTEDRQNAAIAAGDRRSADIVAERVAATGLAIAEGRHLLIENSEKIAAPLGFARSIDMLTGMRFDDDGEALRYVLLHNGWIGIEAQNGMASIHYEMDSVDPAIIARVIDMIRMSRDIVRYRLVDGRGFDRPVPPEEAVLALGRRVRAARRAPAGWIDARLPISEADDRMREIVEAYDRGANTAAALLPLLGGGRASLFSVSAADREAVCHHIGQKWNVPTKPYAALRVLDRPDNGIYSAMIDRHITSTSLQMKPTLTRLGVDFANGARKVIYDRLALPFQIDGTGYVITTSRVRSDTAEMLGQPAG